MGGTVAARVAAVTFSPLPFPPLSPYAAASVVALASASGEAFILHKHALAFLLLDLVFALYFLLFCSSTPHLPVSSTIHRAHCVFWLGSWIRIFDSRSTILHLDL
jgi:hypothetical protein